MKKIIIAPDSFKETMTNIEVTEIIYNTLKLKYPDCDYKLFPIADGGEGSLNAFYKIGGELKTCESVDANNEVMNANYLIYDNSIVIEVAQNVGFKYKKESSNPGNTTTYGIGLVLQEALKTGFKKVYICLGGTITNDGGCGLASALGVKFYDQNNQAFIPTGDTLKNICHIDDSLFIEKYKDIEIIGLCDVVNPLYGKSGASYIFAPQKGATSKQVEELDQGLRHLEKIVIQDLNIDKAHFPGAGAAGGLGYCIVALLKGKLKKGIDTVLDFINFKDELTDNTVVITGEGKLDSQSLNGKVISGVIERVKSKGVYVIVVCGKLEGNKEDYYQYGIDEILVTNEENLDFEVVKIKCKEQLKNTISKISLM